MLTTTVFAGAAVLLAALVRYRGFRWGLGGAFFLIWLFLALRCDFGNDYATYAAIFREISEYDSPGGFENPLRMESGWIVLNWLCRPIGFFGMIALIASAQCLVYWRLISKFVPRNWQWFAVFLFAFTPSLMLLQASAMRQAVAIMLFTAAIPFVLRRDVLRYTLLIALAFAFHQSAILFWPAYFLGARGWRIGLGTRVATVTAFAVPMFLSAQLDAVVRILIEGYFPRWEVYGKAGVAGTGLGFLFAGAMLVLLMAIEPRLGREARLVVRMSAVALVLMPAGLIVQMAARLGFYFLPAMAVAYPVVASSWREPLKRGAFLIIVVSYTLYLYVQFFRSTVYELYYGQYQTIFAAPAWR